jgi:hypothetical protein
MPKLDYQETFNKLLKTEEKDIHVMQVDIKPLFTIANKIDVYKDDNLARQYGSVIACITVNPITLKPFIVVDSLFDKLSVRAKVFVIYHEIGHYQNGDFIRKDIKRKLSQRILDKFKYSEKETLADLYAMDHMDSLRDAMDSLEEIHSVITKAISNGTLRFKDAKKSVKQLTKSHPKRVRDLEALFYDGPYYINEAAKTYEGVYEEPVIKEAVNHGDAPLVTDGVTLLDTIPSKNSIRIKCGINEICFEENGDIFVNGKLIENDAELVQGFRDLINGSRAMYN